MIPYNPLMMLQAIWRRDEFSFRQLFFDCYPDKTLEDSHIAFILACGAKPLLYRLLTYAGPTRASRSRPCGRRELISVGPRAVKRESELQLSLPL